MAAITTSFTAKDWDQVRTAFATSLMVDTPLSSLAQNLEGPDWPIKGKTETPAAYIDLTFEEVQELLVERGQRPDRVQQLVGILKETLAFDTPFGDMVVQSAAAAERENPFLKNLARLEIPESFPIEFTALGAGTLEFCRLEQIATLGQFAVFAQSLSQNVIVGGDFRGLLNALSHIDEASLAKYVPFRPGTKGLHLIEALAQTVKAMPYDQRSLLPGKADKLNPSMRERVSLLVAYFDQERLQIARQLAAGTSLERLAVILNDAPTEAAVCALLAPHVRPRSAGGARRGNWFTRLFKRR